MADDKKSDGGGGSAWAEFKWFFFILAGLFILWVISGGAERASKNDKFIKENEGLQPGETYDRPVNLFGETI